MSAATHIGLRYVLVNWHWTADELKYVPAGAALVAFADVHEVMTSDTRNRLRTALLHRLASRTWIWRGVLSVEVDKMANNLAINFHL